MEATDCSFISMEMTDKSKEKSLFSTAPKNFLDDILIEDKTLIQNLFDEKPKASKIVKKKRVRKRKKKIIKK